MIEYLQFQSYFFLSPLIRSKVSGWGTKKVGKLIVDKFLKGIQAGDAGQQSYQ